MEGSSGRAGRLYIVLQKGGVADGRMGSVSGRAQTRRSVSACTCIQQPLVRDGARLYVY